VNKDSLRYLRHELRTLLNHIMGYSEILKEEHGLGGDPKDELQELYLESEKLIDIFKRSFYQGESVRVDFNPGIFKQNLFGPLYNIIGLTQRLKQRWEKENRLEGPRTFKKSWSQPENPGIGGGRTQQCPTRRGEPGLWATTPDHAYAPERRPGGAFPPGTDPGGGRQRSQ
jgi:hypothetical protein